MDKVDEVIRILGLDYVQRLPFVVKLSNRTKVQPNLLVAIGLFITLLLCITVVFGSLFTTLLMFLLPAYDTFKAIESNDMEEQTRLLTYWMVFGTFFSMDHTFRWVLGFLPYYHLIRFVILSTLYSKQFQGAELIYTHIQKPFFLKYRELIDSFVEPVENSLAGIGQKFTKKD